MRRLIAPTSYVQGPGVLTDSKVYTALSAERAFVLGGETALSMVVDNLRDGLGTIDVSIVELESGIDSCTFTVIDSLAKRVRQADADLVVGVGGGVALDTAKAVAERSGTELAVVPTIASTDAPCSSVAVVYDDEGGFAGYVHRKQNPELVCVDTAVIASSPTEFLRYGLGDAFATRFEAETVANSWQTTHAGGIPTDAALTLARSSFENIEQDGPTALAAVERNAVTPALERIVETNTLLSGIGFESSGLAAAHAFGKGFSQAGVKAPHGLLIAFSTIAQLILEDREATVLENALKVAHSVGIDNRLADFSAESKVVEVATAACRDNTTMSNEPFEVTPAAAASALRTADELLSNG